MLLIILTTVVLVVISAISVGPMTPSIIIVVGASATSSLLGSVSLFHIDEILFFSMVHNVVWHSQIFDVNSPDVYFGKLQELFTVRR